jgi:FtsP/CotA-like multicopper oxidase with cupredoxin domain
MKRTSVLLSLGCGLALTLIVSQAASATGDPFFLIKKNIVMEEINDTLPVPDYEYVDVIGAVKDPASECPGGIDNPTIATVSGDTCMLRPQLTFTNGYLDTNGTVVTPNAAVYNGARSSITIVGHVGDVLQATVRNELPEAVNEVAIETGFYAPADNLQIIHWHGMELDNESDGTPVTEFGIEPGMQRLYQYRLYRPGTYWFHPHTLPLLTEHRGMVGKLVIRSWEEEILTIAGVLPIIYKPVQLTDTTVASEINKTKTRNGAFFDGFSQFEVDNNLIPNIAIDLTGDNICNRGIGGDCIVPEGELVFVNGKVPTSDADIETILVPEGRAARVAFINSSNERFYRFRLLEDGEEPPWGPAVQVRGANTGQCYAGVGQPKFSGADPLSCDQGLPLYRIGGQNGLLDHVRLEGQPELAPGEPPRPYDTVIRTGEDFIGVAERTEFIVLTKGRDGQYLEPGESLYIWNIDYPHGAVTTFFDNNIGDGDVNNRDFHARKLVRIKVVPNFLHLPAYDIAAGDPLAVHPLIPRPTEDIISGPADSLDAVPVAFDPFLPGVPFKGKTDPRIMLTNRLGNNSRFPSINANKGEYDGFPINGTNVPTQDSVRYARVGDVIEFVYANNTNAAHHPFHMHGFSFQLISIHNFTTEDTNGDGVNDAPVLIDPPLFTYPYKEFVDVEVMQPQKAVKYRMKMNDRFKMPDDTKFSYFQLLAKFPYDQGQTYGGPGDIPNPNAEMGGGVGRWLFHCHILHHAMLGMIADLCVAPAGDPDASGCKIFIDPNVYDPI